MNHLPSALGETVAAALRGLGDSGPIRSVQPVGGGCINNASRLESGQRRYLLKWNAAAQPNMFEREARGLELIAATRTVRVPAVYAYGDRSAHAPAYILLEFLDGPRGDDPGRLGEQLAALHSQGTAPQYGLECDNYLGSTPQINGWEPDWASFFAQHRLRPQLELAIRGGHMNGRRRERLERLIERLPSLLGGIERRPALIHGDLWSGNVIPGPDGLALIDPAVSYSDREAEIAYTELFGGFSARFYAAYQSTWPLDPGYAGRRELYNLYHLLNHLSLFGESYGGQVDEVLTRY